MSGWENAAPNEADFEVAIDDIDPKDVDSGGRVNRKGWYHFEIVDVKPELETMNDKGQGKTPTVRFDCAVVCTVPGQSPAGMLFSHRLYVGAEGGGPPKDFNRKQMAKFAKGLGLIAEADGGGWICTETKQPMKGLPIALWRRAKGMQFIAEIREEEYQGKPQFRIPFNDVFQVDDPQVADVAKSLEHLKIIGKESAMAPAVGGKGAAGNGAKKPASGGKSTTQAKAPEKTASGMDLSDL